MRLIRQIYYWFWPKIDYKWCVFGWPTHPHKWCMHIMRTENGKVDNRPFTTHVFDCHLEAVECLHRLKGEGSVDRLHDYNRLRDEAAKKDARIAELEGENIQLKSNAGELSRLRAAFGHMQQELCMLRSREMDADDIASETEYKAKLKSENKLLTEELEDWRNSAKIASSENCPPDEHHCTCVGVLRKTVKDQDAKIKNLTEQKDALISVLTTVRSDIVLIAELGAQASPHQTIIQIDQTLAKFTVNEQMLPKSVS